MNRGRDEQRRAPAHGTHAREPEPRISEVGIGPGRYHLEWLSTTPCEKPRSYDRSVTVEPARVTGVDENLVHRLLRPAGPDPLCIEGDRVWTRVEVRAAVARFAAVLRAAAPGPDARVVLLAANDSAFVIGYLATLWAGLVAVPANSLSPVDELAREVEAVDASLLVVGPQCEALAAELINRRPMPILHPLAATDHAPIEPERRRVEDPAALVFTTGTAGAPKAAILTHGSLAANLDQLGARLADVLIPGEAALGLLPFFHVFGLNVALGLSLAAGLSLVLVPEFHPGAAIAAIAKHQVAVMAGVPAMYAAFLALNDEAAAGDALASVRIAVSGGAALPPSVAAAMATRFGVHLEEGYGLTETSPVVTTTVGTVGAAPGSVGVALPGVEVRVVDVDGEDTLVGDPGEVWVRGANVFPGYWNDATATARVLTPSGWLRTGDLGVLDDAGALTLVDRAKDLVIVSGFNVFPAEVEDVLRTSEDVAEVAVAGMPDDRTGETVVAWIVAAPGRTVDLDALDALAGRHLARYKRPTRYELVTTLPRTYIGKLLRRDLRRSVTDLE